LLTYSLFYYYNDYYYDYYIKMYRLQDTITKSLGHMTQNPYQAES